MTDRQVNALAAFLADGTSWDTPGIVAELRRQRGHYDPWQLAAAMCKRASDPANLTPRLQPFDGEGFVGCRRHPGASVRTSGVCGVCHSEANAAEYEPRRPRDPAAVVHPLEDALARLNRETADA